MAYEDSNTNPFSTSTSAYDAPIHTNASSTQPLSQPDAIITTGSPGGLAGTWSGFEETNTDENLLKTTSTGSSPKTGGLFDGLAIESSQDNETSEFVSLSTSAHNAGSWNDDDTTIQLTTEQTSDEKIEGGMDPAVSDREQMLAEKYAYMPWGCKTMFVLFDTPVAIHWSFILVLVANFVYSIFYYKEVSIFSICWSLLAAIFWFIFVLTNQIAHVVAAKVWSVKTCVAVCWMFGGYREVIIAHSTWQHVKVSLSGPISHIPWIVLFGFGATVVGQMEGVSICYCVYTTFERYFGFNILNFCLWQNIWLFGWNLLLPCYPLDGALIFTCFLLERGFAPDRVLAIMMRISGVCLVGCALWAFFTRHLWAFLSTAFLLWNVVYMCWYLGRADRHPLFGLKTSQQLEDEDFAHANKIGGEIASSVAMQAMNSQMKTSPAQNNAWS